MIRNNKGASLAIVLMVGTVLIIFSVVLGSFAVNEAKQTSLEEKETQAYYIARAGAEAASSWIINNLDDFSSYDSPIISRNNDFSIGKFDLEIIDESTRIIINSTGKIENGEDSFGVTRYIDEVVTIMLMKKDIGQGGSQDILSSIDMAMFSDTRIVIKNNCKITGDIGSNSTEEDSLDIDKNNNEIYGTVYIGLGGDPDKVLKKDRADVNVQTLDEVRDYPSIEFPDIFDDISYISKGDLKLEKGETKTIDGSSNYEYSEIEVVKSILFIDMTQGDGIIQAKSLKIDDNSQIILIGTGSLKLYLNDSFDVIKESKITTNSTDQLEVYVKKGDSKIENQSIVNCSIYTYDGDVTIKNSSITGSIIGGDSIIINQDNNIHNEHIVKSLIYAPDAVIELKSNTILEGSIIGNDLTIHSKSDITYNPVYFPSEIVGISEKDEDSSPEFIKIWK